MKQPIPWRGLSFLEKLALALMPIVALGILLLPFLDQAFLRPLSQLPGMRPLVNWSVNAGGSWIVGLLFLGSWVGLILLERNRLNNNEQLWFDTGCPQCQERELVRVSRQRGDRFYALLGVRAYRYACRNCTWRGLRIGRRHHRFDEDAVAQEFGTEGAPASDELLPDQDFAPTLAVTSGDTVLIPTVATYDAPVPEAVTLAPGAAEPITSSPRVTGPASAAPVVTATAAAWNLDVATSDAVLPEPEAARAANGAIDWTGTGEPNPPAMTKTEELFRLKEETGFSDEELEWLWRRVSESEE